MVTQERGTTGSPMSKQVDRYLDTSYLVWEEVLATRLYRQVGRLHQNEGNASNRAGETF